MDTEITTSDGEPILVQFSEARGMQPVAPLDGAELAQRSAEALDKAMDTIRQMADRVISTIQEIQVTDRPTEVEVEFGLVLDAEAGVLVARVAGQAGFKVKLVWKASKSE
jgi:hypothetical protein